MDSGSPHEPASSTALLEIEDCLDAEGDIALPPGDTLISLIERNIANVGDAVAYRYLDYAASADGRVDELTWAQFGVRLRAVSACLQKVAARGDRIAILAPQGFDYIAGFYAAINVAAVAVPLFPPELPGHAERLDTALRDAIPSVALTTTAAMKTVEAFLAELPRRYRPQVIAIDAIPDSAQAGFSPVRLDMDDVSHLQYTSGATRPPAGVEVTHRSSGTNLVQMILSLDLLDRNIHGLSWLPLYHDMGLSIIGFPALYGGHSTLMSPAAFIRRPQRWIAALSAESRHGRVVTAAPNFAYELTAQRGLPAPGAGVDLSNVVMIIGSEPVSMAAITAFNAAFAPHGLPRTAIKPSYGIAEATLFVSTIEPTAEASAVYLDREQLGAGRAVRVPAGSANAVAHVSCGRAARSQWAVIVDPDADEELPDGAVGEIWVHGGNVARGYWQRPDETRLTFGAKLRSRLAEGSHAEGAPIGSSWLRNGDLGMYLDGELFITGRIADMVTIEGRNYYPHDIETTVAQASPTVRPGYAVAFSVRNTTGAGERLVVVAERAAGVGRADPRPAIEAIGDAVARRHGLSVADVRFLPAGAIPRTTSGKLGRVACRSQYLSGTLGLR